MGFGGGFLPMAGNPGDYAWGQRGLDDIITQMMELQKYALSCFLIFFCNMIDLSRACVNRVFFPLLVLA